MLKTPLALLPVLGFLAALVLMDSFKLVPLKAVLRAILAGAAAALLCAQANDALIGALGLPVSSYSRYLAPALEELAKGLYVAYLVRRQRVGFLVDAAIYGFAVGAGFALLENVDYLWALQRAPTSLWLVRGLGTALLHGGSAALFAMLGKSLADRHPERGLLVFLPAWAAAAALHSAFNHFILPPLAATAVLLMVLPALLVLVFSRSERATREWLGVGFDTDVELLKLLSSGGAGQTRIGGYLRSLRARFPGLVVADMSCLLRVQLELSVRAKGLLMAREAGIAMPVGRDVRSAFEELRYLEKSIGPTGLLALNVVLTRSSRDLWELYILEQASQERTPGTAGGGL